EARALLLIGRRRADDTALVAGAWHRSAWIGVGRPRASLRRHEIAQRLEVRRLGGGAARQDLELAASHETTAGDRLAENVGVGHRVAIGVQLGDAGIGVEADDPGAGREKRE